MTRHVRPILLPFCHWGSLEAHPVFWTFERVFLEEAWFWGVRVGFGGREGELASALIIEMTKSTQ